jgi:hypothetical protein
MAFYGYQSNRRYAAGANFTFKNSAGTGTISLASVADNNARQSTKIDLDDARASRFLVECEFEFAATPTANRVVELWWNPSSSATAGTNNKGNCDGTDSAYTGYSSNLADSILQLQFIGAFIVTAQATATVQKGIAGAFSPLERYGSIVVWNRTAASFHSTNTNQLITLKPIISVLDVQ